MEQLSVNRDELRPLLEAIREKWLQTEGARCRFGGEPHQEVEAYFRLCHFHVNVRIRLLLEVINDRDILLHELQQLRKEVEICGIAFDYFEKERNGP